MKQALCAKLSMEFHAFFWRDYYKLFCLATKEGTDAVITHLCIWFKQTHSNEKWGGKGPQI